jgi:hypothetical protein
MKVASGKPRGRPSKKTPQAVSRILKVVRTGLPLKFAAQAGDIDEETLALWRANDPEFAQALTHARLAAVEDRWELIKKAASGTEEKPGDWRAVAWQLERSHPLDFARPEVALTLQQNNVTQNFLSISISEKDAREIEAEAAPIREGVQAMFQAYRPGAKGNGEGKVHDVEAKLVSEQSQQPSVGQQPPITHRGDSDAQNPAFWRRLITSPPECKVAKNTAVFAIRTLLLQTVGFKGHRADITFSDDPTLEEMFSRLEQLGGPACWAKAQALAGFAQ